MRDCCAQPKCVSSSQRAYAPPLFLPSARAEGAQEGAASEGAASEGAASEGAASEGAAAEGGGALNSSGASSAFAGSTSSSSTGGSSDSEGGASPPVSLEAVMRTLTTGVNITPPRPIERDDEGMTPAVVAYLAAEPKIKRKLRMFMGRTGTIRALTLEIWAMGGVGLFFVLPLEALLLCGAMAWLFVEFGGDGYNDADVVAVYALIRELVLPAPAPAAVVAPGLQAAEAVARAAADLRAKADAKATTDTWSDLVRNSRRALSRNALRFFDALRDALLAPKDFLQLYGAPVDPSHEDKGRAAAAFCSGLRKPPLAPLLPDAPLPSVQERALAVRARVLGYVSPTRAPCVYFPSRYLNLPPPLPPPPFSSSSTRPFPPQRRHAAAGGRRQRRRQPAAGVAHVRAAAVPRRAVRPGQDAEDRGQE